MSAHTMPTLDPSPLVRLTVPRPVGRYDYIRQQCAGHRVLDLGAYDETEITRPQHESWRWLHAQIAATATEVLGIDASPALREPGHINTPVGTRILYGTVENLDRIITDYKPDLIVGGELIEHTPNTLGWLSRLAQHTPGTRIILTTPNTTSMVNVLLALLSRENNHPDHLHVYSYRTLHTLMSRVPMTNMKLVPYYYDPHLFYSRLSKLAAPLIATINTLALRPIQWLWPMASFGWIIDATLGHADDIVHPHVAALRRRSHN